MHAEHYCQLAAGGNTVTGAKVARMYQGTKLVAQLDVKRNVAFRLQVDRKHWLSLRPILHEIGLLQEPICLPAGGRRLIGIQSVFRRVVADTPVGLACRELPDAKLSRVILVALVDLGHRQITWLYDVFSRFHLLRGV